MRICPGTRAARWLLLALGTALFAAGCSKPTGTVSGTVTYKGQKLKGGQVVFTPSSDSGYPVSAEIKEDGTYTIEKCPTGPVKISVETSYLRPPAGTVGARNNAPKELPPNAGYKPPDVQNNLARYTEIPDKYENASTSGLTYTVTSGPQTHDIPLD